MFLYYHKRIGKQKGEYMKTSKFLTIAAITLALSTTNFAMAKGASSDFRVATVDLQKIVESSPAINSLKMDRKNKIESLTAFVEKARTDVNKETNATKKKALEDKYNKELNERKSVIDKEYAQKLTEIDKNVTALIKTKAKELGYDLTLTKSIVLDGGDDITAEILKGLK